MLKYNFLTIAIFSVCFLGVFTKSKPTTSKAGGGVQTTPQRCINGYIWTVDDKPRVNVDCEVEGSRYYSCPHANCTANNLPVDQGLYFTNCQTLGQPVQPVPFVWPTMFNVVNHDYKYLQVIEGYRSQTKDGNRTLLEDGVGCEWQGPDEQNALRPVCTSCVLEQTS
ncbi:hypothetical protein O181_027542 [Austropuccinia psidii MF-1]|uniref:Secreted protein n=1 Tax=Austropuccinia psidii MF-1 TaxID=1389203 RepID=A0A9Q3H1S8_9BASI|nr:hypothetical protein [Austropuccinia psidii MF-1]